MSSADSWCTFLLYVQMAVVNFLEKWIIFSKPFRVMKIKNASFSKLKTCFSCLETRFWHFVTQFVRVLRHENLVSSLESRLSTYFWAVSTVPSLDLCIPFNPLSPKSDQYQNSPCDISALQNRLVMRIKDMITQDTKSWYFNNLSLLLLKETYKDSKWEFKFWYQGLKG